MTSPDDPAQSASEARDVESNQADSAPNNSTSEAVYQQPISSEERSVVFVSNDGRSVVFTRNGTDHLTVINKLADTQPQVIPANEVSFQRLLDFAKCRTNEYHLVDKGETYELRGCTIAQHQIDMFCLYKQLVLDTTPDDLACDD